MLDILLGLLVIGLAAYLWQKFPAFQWFFLALLCFFLLMTILLVVKSQNKTPDLDTNKNNNVPKVIINFREVVLGDKWADVNFKFTLEPEPASKIPGIGVYKVKKSSTEPVLDFVDVDEMSRTVKRIYHQCAGATDPRAEKIALNEVGCGDTGDSIGKRYGAYELTVLCSRGSIPMNQNEIRYYDLASYNVRYRLVKNIVVGMEVAYHNYFDKVDADSLMKCASR